MKRDACAAWGARLLYRQSVAGIHTRQGARTVGIIELLERVGEDNVQLQNLVESMDDISVNKRGDSRVSFWTNGINATEIAVGKARNVGLVLWLPTELVEKAKADSAAAADA